MARSTPDKGSEPLEALLEASGRGDRQAFAEAYRIAAPRLFAVALRMLRRRDLAEDVLQESFISIWRKAGQYRSERGRPLAWMASIVRNRAIDQLRSKLGDALAVRMPCRVQVETAIRTDITRPAVTEFVDPYSLLTVSNG